MKVSIPNSKNSHTTPIVMEKQKAIGFSLVDLLNNDDRLQFRLSPVFMALVAFCFSMTIGVVWEFFEFGMDTFMGTDMQKDTIVQSITTVMLDNR